MTAVDPQGRDISVLLHTRRGHTPKRMSAYERKSLKAIHAWKEPGLSWSDRLLAYANLPLAKAARAIKRLPGYDRVTGYGKPALDWVLQKTVGGLVKVLNDVAQSTVRPYRIFAEFRKLGLEVHDHTDIQKLDLEQVDRALGWLDTKYKTLALTEGAVAGSVGAPGIAPDIVALIALHLRAIGEYATYCGFRISSQEERLFAFNVLNLASSPDDAAKHVALAQLVRISKDVASKKTWEKLNQHVYVHIVRSLAESLGGRLTKAKLAETIPYVGAVIGGGFNAYFTSKVCDSAFFLYRERFLAEKYGADIIEDTVAPAQELKFNVQKR